MENFKRASGTFEIELITNVAVSRSAPASKGLHQVGAAGAAGSRTAERGGGHPEGGRGAGGQQGVQDLRGGLPRLQRSQPRPRVHRSVPVRQEQQGEGPHFGGAHEPEPVLLPRPLRLLLSRAGGADRARPQARGPGEQAHWGRLGRLRCEHHSRRNRRGFY